MTEGTKQPSKGEQILTEVAAIRHELQMTIGVVPEPVEEALKRIEGVLKPN